MKSKPGIWLGAAATAALIGRMSFGRAFPGRHRHALVWSAGGRIKSPDPRLAPAGSLLALTQRLWPLLSLFVAWPTLYIEAFFALPQPGARMSREVVKMTKLGDVDGFPIETFLCVSGILRICLWIRHRDTRLSFPRANRGRPERASQISVVSVCLASLLAHAELRAQNRRKDATWRSSIDVGHICYLSVQCRS